MDTHFVGARWPPLSWTASVETLKIDKASMMRQYKKKV
jgi:hypothetical protein